MGERTIKILTCDACEKDIPEKYAHEPENGTVRVAMAEHWENGHNGDPEFSWNAKALLCADCGKRVIFLIHARKLHEVKTS